MRKGENVLVNALSAKTGKTWNPSPTQCFGGFRAISLMVLLDILLDILSAEDINVNNIKTSPNCWCMS